MRTLNRIYAWLFGYFWLPCPVCGRMFGGHEIVKIFTAALITDDGKAHSVCTDPQCSHDAAVLNMAHGHSQFVRDPDGVCKTDDGQSRLSVGLGTKFLGRTLDEKTMTYSYPDGSGGKLPEEMRQDVIEASHLRVKFNDGTYGGNGIFVLSTIWKWKKRLGISA